MAIGERTPLALVSGPASGRMAVAEAITNIAATRIGKLSDIKLSANWMCAAGQGREDEVLYDTVRTVGMEFCPALGLTIPVGKDSMSMRTAWVEDGIDKAVTSPVSLIVSAFAPVLDVRQTVTPQLVTETDNRLLLIDLGAGRARLGGSALAQVYGQLGDQVPDIDEPAQLTALFDLVQECLQGGQLLAYHDRSDGGLAITLLEMAFAGHCGLAVDLQGLGEEPLAVLFNEEAGAVLQVPALQASAILQRAGELGLGGCIHEIGQATVGDSIRISHGSESWLKDSRLRLHRIWAETSYRLQSLRDNPECAEEEFSGLRENDPGLSASLSFDIDDDIAAPFINRGERPRVAILREQGVNGHVEMAAAFHRAGFTPFDVHMSDLFSGRFQLETFRGLVACGGFSYGDVLGAGEGWAKSILFNATAREQFKNFFHREDTFALGVCNGCQMLSNLHELIPGAEHWPRFVRNQSEQFEARVCMVEVQDSPSVFLQGMAGSRMPIAVAHGDGHAAFGSEAHLDALLDSGNLALRYVDNYGKVTETYPANPNGSPAGVTGITTADGRVTIMMPHPERVYRAVTNSWSPDDWSEDGAWMRMFRNARVWAN